MGPLNMLIVEEVLHTVHKVQHRAFPGRLTKHFTSFRLCGYRRTRFRSLSVIKRRINQLYTPKQMNKKKPPLGARRDQASHNSNYLTK